MCTRSTATNNIGWFFLVFSVNVVRDLKTNETPSDASKLFTPLMRRAILVEAVQMLASGKGLREFCVDGVRGKVVRLNGGVSLGVFTGTHCSAEFEVLDSGGGKGAISFLVQGLDALKLHLNDPVFCAGLHLGDEDLEEVQKRIDAAIELQRAAYSHGWNDPRYN